MLLFLSSPIEPIQLTDIVDTHGFGGLGLFPSFLFDYFSDRLANIIASQVNQTKGSDRKMWLEVWEEKAVIPLCSAGSYQITFISSCRKSELQCYRHRLVRQLLKGAVWELCPCLRRREAADVTHTGCWMASPPPVLSLPLLHHTLPSSSCRKSSLRKNSYFNSSSRTNYLYF